MRLPALAFFPCLFLAPSAKALLFDGTPDPATFATHGTVDFLDNGPASPEFGGFGDSNPAAAFDGRGAHLTIADPGDASPLDFTNGDSITLEAWVSLDSVGEGQNVYLVGKGRTYSDTASTKENQNYALRLRATGGTASPSFLFASDLGYHRWTTTAGFAAGTGWHHVAVTYTFGDGGSIRGFVDGEESDGAWDLEGPTDRPPIVDNDAVWIGSARNGDPSSSLHGSLDNVAIHRTALPADVLLGRYVYTGVPPAPPTANPRPGEVLVEIFEGVGTHTAWPRRTPNTPDDSYVEEAMAFPELAPKYDSWGVRSDRTSPILVRAWCDVVLPRGEFDVLIRSRGGSRLFIDGEEAARTPFFVPKNIDGHNPVTHYEAIAPGIRPLRLGDSESLVKLSSDGRPHRLRFESLVGGAKLRPELGETVVAIRQGDAPFTVIAPTPTAAFPLTDATWPKFARRHQEAWIAKNAGRRAAASADQDAVWGERHELARAHIESLPPLPHGSIDGFIDAKIARAAVPSSPSSNFASEILPILSDNCFRCHGEKEKGGLRLDERDHALAGGDSGEPSIVPGDATRSYLIEMVKDTGDDRMPPKGDPLRPDQIATLERWVEAGAPWGSSGTAALTRSAITSDLEFLRRLTFDTIGLPPTADEARAFLADPDPDKRARTIDRLLADPRWADAWVPYWQDVLAENPNLLKPTLNNTGPFRDYLFEALYDNKPLDRIVTELVTFRGSKYYGGAGGFAMASENDAPMAAKAHILGTAFLGIEMKCARCHDSPYHSSTQRDLFELAALLAEKPVKVPASSSVPSSFFTDRKSLIKVTLDPGKPVAPSWPFEELVATPPSEGSGTRERLALQITRPENRRFAQVMANRVWARYLGTGIVAPVHDWEGNAPSHPELLDFLARELVSHGYDLKHLARLILNSAAYQRRPGSYKAETPETRFFAAPQRRRLSAEQIVDSLYAISGLPIETEELNFDVEAFRPADRFLNLGQPRRAWQFVSLSNERDRPSLALPRAQAVVDVLESFGWRTSRQEPATLRDTAPNVLQPGTLANGTLGTWVTRLTDRSAITALCLRPDLTVDALVDELFLRFHTREPSADERATFVALLSPGFDGRLTGAELREPLHLPRRISWTNHLSAEANTIKLEDERVARQGDPPSARLSEAWRTRAEDAIWALINAPEMIFSP